MSCTNKHRLMDLYFHEGDEAHLAEAKDHAAHCPECRVYLAGMKQTLTMLSVLGDEEPPAHIMGDILAAVSVSTPRPVPQKKSAVEVGPVLQIAFGEVFVFALIYFIKLQISFTGVWDAVEHYPILRSIGSYGVSVLLVLLAGSFITLALAPILLMDARKKFGN